MRRALLLLCLAAARAVAQPAPLDGIGAYIDSSMKAWGVPGLAIAVVKDDRIVFARGYGVRRIGDSARVDEHTIFAIGSITKSFTAAALATLADEGRLHWDDPVVKHIPTFQLHEPYLTREITLRDLLTHRTGYDRAEPLVYGGFHSRDEIVRRLRHQQPSWGLRSRFAYNNAMYVVAGQVAATVSGKCWDDLVRERLIAPLGMSRTTTSVRELARQPNVATPHARLGGPAGEIRQMAWLDIDNGAPAGSINSSVTDMAQWLRLQLARGTLDGRRFFTIASADEMVKPQMLVRDDLGGALYAPEAKFVAYGLGWFINDHHGRKLVSHGGLVDGMVAHVGIVPEERLGVVVLSNLSGAQLPAAVVLRVIDTYLGAPARDWSARYLALRRAADGMARVASQRALAVRKPNVPTTLPLARYEGTFTSALFGDARVVREGETLAFRYSKAFSGTLEHWEGDTFRVRWEGPELRETFATFAIAAGRVASIDVKDFGAFARKR